jgi:hypothetical protein
VDLITRQDVDGAARQAGEAQRGARVDVDEGRAGGRHRDVVAERDERASRIARAEGKRFSGTGSRALKKNAARPGGSMSSSRTAGL